MPGNPRKGGVNAVNHSVLIVFTNQGNRSKEAIMTISALSSSSYQSSPLQQLQKELQSEVSAGTISSTDQSALSSALTDIDS